MPDATTIYQSLCEHFRETALLTSVASTIEWEEQTYMPSAAGKYRAEQLSLLARLAHQRNTASKVGEWLDQLEASPLAKDPHSQTGADIRQLRRSYNRKTKLPEPLVAALTKAASLGQQVWTEARKENDYATFAPYLDEIYKLKREEAEAVGYEKHPYDALLDDYEPQATVAEVGPVLGSLGESLAPLVSAIVESPHQPNMAIFDRDYPIEAQSQFGERVSKQLGFRLDAGRIDVTAHPFCTTLGPQDVRLTTRYNPRDLRSGLFGTLHETGHGLYEQGLPSDRFGLPTGEAVSLGVHESQSRMWEIQVGLGRPFWEYYYPQLQQTFPQALGDVSLDDFYFAANESRPSLIRVEADEATYNLHILIRFELEVALIEGELDVAELPEAWNSKYQKYLGITPPDYASGVMQDVHWSAGLVGYFATYALGNLYAAQFFAQAQQDVSDLDNQIRSGNFEPLLDWLRTSIHNHGQQYSAGELVEKITGSPLSSEALLGHLRGKFGELYRL